MDEPKVGDSVLAMCACGFHGNVTLYDIGDGSEWACPNCEMCYPSAAVVGPDMLTDGERKALEMGRDIFRELHGEPDLTLDIITKTPEGT